jgi:hypothetical protein
MAQIGISVDENGKGQIFTDRSGTLPCERLVDVPDWARGGYPPPKCGGNVTFETSDITFETSGTAVCDKCGQTYKVDLSG